jgi:putative hydrolase of the HAD superfamily
VTTTSDIIRRHVRPLSPIPTGVEPRLRTLPGIRAVLFDVYGTLLISGVGEVGTAAAPPAQALADACRTQGLTVGENAEACVELFVETIEQFHAESRADGIEHPEVDIVAVWRRLVPEYRRRGWMSGNGDVEYEQLAVEYEMRANPVWPMPSAGHCLARLAGRTMALGIISNAQFFTPQLFPALLGGEVPDLGFSPELCVFSFQHGRAKPGTYLFERVLESLAERNIRAEQALYVGNDMRNDVMPAGRLGMKTALFAGDNRSLRLRAGGAQVQGAEPDLVVTELAQVVECVIPRE